jgi:hypothetical protein
MIKTIFPVNILVKDYDLPEQFTQELSSIIQSIFQSLMLEKELSRKEIGDNEFPIFTEENMAAFPVLKQLREMFIDSFYELADSYEENILSRDLISQMVEKNVGKLPLMQKGEYKRLHNHFNTSAFAIFYLTDVDNDQYGGKLILKDPAFHSNAGFHPPPDYEVETRKNRMVVAPAYIWHEVTPYTGDEDRITVVINLHIDTLQLDDAFDS